jgi:Leucine-rich repeat (LRR) protein
MKLEHLDLNNNFLSQLPNLLECEYLSKVDVSFNKIITLSEQDVMGLDTLTVCNLSKNYLE